MIDLHTHTTASDGTCTPDELVTRAAAAGVEVLGVTDHDTVGAAGPAAAACRAAGIQFVVGIEMTSAVEGTDVHVLGYFIDPDSVSLQGFLANQRRRRVDRVREMIRRLAPHGVVLDAEAVLAPAVGDPSRSAGRPWIARALVDTGQADSVGEAFDRWLSRGRPGYVPSIGAPPADVFAQIHAAGGVASLAHPILIRHDEWLCGFVADGLDAIEAYHSKHDAVTTDRYIAMAGELNVAVSGGSDYHGDDARAGVSPGCVSLPRAAFDLLCARARSPHQT